MTYSLNDILDDVRAHHQCMMKYDVIGLVF